MKKHIKIISAALSALIGFSAVAVFPASAAQLKSERTPAGYISEYKDFLDEYGDLVEAVADGMYNVENSINISAYNFPYNASDTSNLTTLFTVVDHTHPELFFLASSFGFGYRNYGNKKIVTAITPRYQDTSGNTLTKEKIDEMKAEFFSRAQWYLDKVDDSMSDFEKALILHDELVLNSSYLLSGETYDLMVNGEGKCYGYSEAYSYLLAQVGVKSEIIESDSMNHQWNKVQIDGVYYHVDVTWDDPTYDKPGKVEHTYFLLSDSANNSLPNRYDDYNTDFPSTDTRYDNLKYHDIDTQLCIVGDNTYVADNGSKSISMYNLTSDELTSVYSYSYEYWPAGGGYVWNGGYSGLQEKHGWLYFNNATALYAYDTQSGEVEKYSDTDFEQNVYGVRVIDNKVYAVLAESPNVTGTLQWVDYCLTREQRLEIGDVDGDGYVNVNDVTEIQRFLVDIRDLADNEYAAADYNHDGEVNVNDVTYIQRFIAEFEDIFINA